MLVDLLTLAGLPTIDPMLRRAKEIRRPQNQLENLKKISVSWLKIFPCIECLGFTVILFTHGDIRQSTFLLFQLNAHNVLNTCIYQQLPLTCSGVCYTIFRETIPLLAQQLYAFCNVVT